MTTLVVIAKECLPGRVKTRLCPPFSPHEAAEIAAACLAETLVALAPLPFDDHVLFLDGRPPVGTGERWRVEPQPAGSLDERLAELFDRVQGPSLLVGMDTPHLDPRVLEPLTTWPDAVDAVFGPATDGGFWALGLREPDGSLVRGVPMSRADTGRHQRDRLRGLRVLDLPPMTDVDTVGDLARAAAGSPRLAAVLQSLRAAS